MKTPSGINSEKIYSRISEDLATQLDMACAKLRIKRPKAIIRAIEQWVNSETTPESGVRPDQMRESLDRVPEPSLHSIPIESGEIPQSEEARWIDQLRYILNHGDAETVEAITRNLDRFSLLTRLVNRDPGALDEIDRLARYIADDRSRRVEFLHQLDQRYPARGKGAEPNEARAQTKKKTHPRKTGTGRSH